MSLIMGLLFGGISAALGYSAYQKYFKNVNGQKISDKNEILGGLILAAILSVVMCSRWQKSGKFMPAGLVGLLSVIMSIFYVYRLINPTLPLKGRK